MAIGRGPNGTIIYTPDDGTNASGNTGVNPQAPGTTAAPAPPATPPASGPVLTPIKQSPSTTTGSARAVVQPVPTAGNGAGAPQTTPPASSLDDLMKSSLLAPWTVPFAPPQFNGPTYTQPTLSDFYANDPGLQARLQLGQQAMERSAAARGTLLNTGTVQSENQAAQDYASNEYNNYVNQKQSNFGTMYNADLSNWTTNYNQALQQYQQAYNIFTNNQNNAFNKLASVSGFGQTSAAQLASTGLGFANVNANTNANGANTIGNLYTQAGNANAAGTVGAQNAWNNFYGQLSNNIQQAAYGSSYKNPQGS